MLAMHGLQMVPNTTTAVVGDMLEFHFYPYPGGHSVVQGDFTTPCNVGSVSNGFFSGFMTSANADGVRFDPQTIPCLLVYSTPYSSS
jgi:hypothetical protein